uniref:DYW domain-containing protein n=2 Tax=Nymphaea colorata TaxID=210225 RepID=A0A5K0ZNW3_9MAGN
MKVILAYPHHDGLSFSNQRRRELDPRHPAMAAVPPPPANPTTVSAKTDRADLLEAVELLRRCTSPEETRQLHARLVKAGLSDNRFAQNRLTASCALSDARYALEVFARSASPSRFMRNTVVRALAESESPGDAVRFYGGTHALGLPANRYTFPALLKACARLLGLEEGRQAHCHVVKWGLQPDVHVSNTLIHLYASCGRLTQARKVFDEMPLRTVVSWNALISGYVQNGMSSEALSMFREMQIEGTEPNEVTMIGVLTACSHAGALELGKWAHAYIRRRGLGVRIGVVTALIDMYSKCGCIERAVEVFEGIPDKNIVCYTAMINGLAVNGHGESAAALFDRMVMVGIKPDEISLISVLCACSHSGLVEAGRRYFRDLQRRYNVAPQVEHYGCMVDLLGRSGHLEEAYELVKNMPFEPNAIIWRTLLGACKVHNNVKLGELVVKEIMMLEPHHHGDYVLLSNIYAAAGRWEDVSKIRRVMKDRGIVKTPGCSMIEVGNKIYSFIVKDKSHRHSEEMYKMLDQMAQRLRSAGHVPNTSLVLIDMDEEEKENSLNYHSEKVALAFGLIKTRAGTPIRIVKNLRVCDDCHSAMKLLSVIYEREITVRDRNRFHHFRGGVCSCGDYW